VRSHRFRLPLRRFILTLFNEVDLTATAWGGLSRRASNPALPEMDVEEEEEDDDDEQPPAPVIPK
jgi:hypothetical protein